MSSLSISAAWDETKAILARDGKLFATVALALIVFPQTVFAVIGAPVGPQASGLSVFTYFVVILLGCTAQIALNRLSVPPAVTVGSAIMTGLRRVGPVVIVGLLVAVGVIILAAALLIILGALHLITVPTPGQTPPPSLLLLLMVIVIPVFATFQLVFPVAAVETGNPLKMIRRAWALARHNHLRLTAFIAIIILGFALVVLATQVGLGSVIVFALGKPDPGSVSALAFGVLSGLIQAGFTVVTAIMIARIYTQLAGRHDAQVGVPSSGI
jgi:hypothetical protein